MDDTYEQFPRRMVAVTVLVQVAIYLLGAYILLQISVWLAVIYAACILALEYRVLRHSCVSCYYYGRLCCFGRGKLAATFCRKGDPAAFLKKEIRWVDILPDFLVSLIPLVLGIILLVINFDPILLLAVVGLAVLAFPVQGFIRSTWSCRFCKQRELGCPAERLFSRKMGEKAW
ncbi:MAG: hypothetical protein LUO97_01855 [Methanomicrobiales archaeon]|nr:hypothetical protein [Methanomicrobiales archaeon]